MACDQCAQQRATFHYGPYQCEHELHQMGVPGYEKIPHTISPTYSQLQEQVRTLTEALRKSEQEKGELLAAANSKDWYRPILSEVDSLWVDCGWGDCLHVQVPCVGWFVL